MLKQLCKTKNLYTSSFVLAKGRCIFCNKLTGRNLDLCLECEKVLPWWPLDICTVCGRKNIRHDFLNEKTVPPTPCRICATKKNLLPIYPIFSYSEPIKNMLQQLKFNNKLFYVPLLAELLAKRFIKYYSGLGVGALPQILIPVPLHIKRLRHRGFNQALMLARPICQNLNLTLLSGLIERLRYSPPQMSLPEKSRAKNIQQAFKVNRACWSKLNLSSKKVVIFDDVVTTGGTTMEIAKELKRNNIKDIVVWCCAKTVKYQ